MARAPRTVKVTGKNGGLAITHLGSSLLVIVRISSNRLLILCSEEVLVERSGELMPSLDPVLNA
jgi:hypothetical protein